MYILPFDFIFVFGLCKIIYLTLKLSIQLIQSAVVSLSLYFLAFLFWILPFDKKFFAKQTPLRLLAIAMMKVKELCELIFTMIKVRKLIPLIRFSR